MLVGYVFSRKDNCEFEIVKGSPPGDKKDFNKRLYELLKPYIFDLKEFWLWTKSLSYIDIIV